MVIPLLDSGYVLLVRERIDGRKLVLNAIVQIVRLSADKKTVDLVAPPGLHDGYERRRINFVAGQDVQFIDIKSFSALQLLRQCQNIFTEKFESLAEIRLEIFGRIEHDPPAFCYRLIEAGRIDGLVVEALRELPVVIVNEFEPRPLPGHELFRQSRLAGPAASCNQALVRGMIKFLEHSE